MPTGSPAMAHDQQTIEQLSARRKGPLRQCHPHGCERNVFRPCEGEPLLRAIYLATLAWPISMPNLRSSPWILGAPHNHETEALRDSTSRASRIRFPTGTRSGELARRRSRYRSCATSVGALPRARSMPVVTKCLNRFLMVMVWSSLILEMFAQRRDNHDGHRIRICVRDPSRRMDQ
jgi:hypothetical protein